MYFFFERNQNAVESKKGKYVQYQYFGIELFY